MTNLQIILEFLNQEKRLDIKLYKSFQNLMDEFLMTFIRYIFFEKFCFNLYHYNLNIEENNLDLTILWRRYGRIQKN